MYLFQTGGPQCNSKFNWPSLVFGAQLKRWWEWEQRRSCAAIHHRIETIKFLTIHTDLPNAFKAFDLAWKCIPPQFWASVRKEKCFDWCLKSKLFSISWFFSLKVAYHFKKQPHSLRKNRFTSMHEGPSLNYINFRLEKGQKRHRFKIA